MSGWRQCLVVLREMEVDAAAARVAVLELKTSSLMKEETVPNGTDKHENATNGYVAGLASVKSKKKKVKKKKNSHAADCNAEVFQFLPSQELVQSSYPWSAVIRHRRGRCAIASR